MILPKQSRADSRVVYSHKFVIIIGLLCVLAVIHVTQIVLFALKEDYGETVQGQGTSDIVVENSCAKVESLVVLTGLSELSLLLGKFSHLEIDMSLLHKVALLDTSLGLHDEVLSGFTSCVRH